MGKRACDFSSVAVRMLRYINRCKGAQGWAYRLMDQRVYGARMCRWIRRCADAQVWKRLWWVKRPEQEC